ALEAAIRERGVSNVMLQPLVPREQYLEMLADTDVALITQQAGSGAYFFPNKLLATLAAGNAVLSVADEESELFRAIEKGHFGWNVLPGDAKGLADILLDVSRNSKDIEEKVRNGHIFVEAYEESHVLPAFEAVLKDIAEA
ncbi:MAG: colanic acid biosynthesis glycosyltransferase WcaI, partial [Verrucomicrobiota bacterium]